VLTRTGAAPVKDNVFKNNIFSRNDPYGEGRQLVFTPGAEHVSFISNVFGGGIATEGQRPRTLQDVQSVQCQALHGPQFQDNQALTPAFVSTALYDHRLQPTSPLLDIAAPLTRTSNAGQGDVLPVEDALYFYDGFGLLGEKGDLIAVGDARRVARVVRVDTASQTLQLDRPLAWEQGEIVNLAWTGLGPDIGAYEHGNDGRVSIAIVANSFFVHPGEEVRLRAEIHGNIEPTRYTWQLGDGTLAEGPEVRHSYDFTLEQLNSPGGFPIRVRVHTATGESYVGATFLAYADFADAELPLLHTTFDSDDLDWWWHWKTYRPEPVDWERQVDVSGKGIMRVSDPGGGTLPFRTAPAQWSIDRYPWIYLRYRLQPGTAVGVYLEAFRLENEKRHIWAAAPAGLPDRHLSVVTPYRLVADGEWHTLLIDARVIREKYPDITHLKSVGMERISRSVMGDTYWLDEVAILSAEATQTPAWRSKIQPQQPGHIQVDTSLPGEVLLGEVALNVAIRTYLGTDGRPLFTGESRILIEFGEEPVFTDLHPNELAQTTIDTTRWPDGNYDLTVRVFEQGHEILHHRVPVFIRNRELMIDGLDGPEVVSIFGANITFDNTMTSGESSGWSYPPKDSDPIFGDKGRKIKVSGDEEHLTWMAPGLHHFTVTLYVRDESVGDHVRLLAGLVSDGWIELPYKIEVVESSPHGWKKLALRGEVPEETEANAFRLVADADAAAGSVQVAEVQLDIRRTP
jgi:hypothetical protein